MGKIPAWCRNELRVGNEIICGIAGKSHASGPKLLPSLSDDVPALNTPPCASSIGVFVCASTPVSGGGSAGSRASAYWSSLIHPWRLFVQILVFPLLALSSLASHISNWPLIIQPRVGFTLQWGAPNLLIWIICEDGRAWEGGRRLKKLKITLCIIYNVDKSTARWVVLISFLLIV